MRLIENVQIKRAFYFATLSKTAYEINYEIGLRIDALAREKAIWRSINTVFVVVLVYLFLSLCVRFFQETLNSKPFLRGRILLFKVVYGMHSRNLKVRE